MICTPLGISSFLEHISDEKLAAFLSNELKPLRAFAVKTHLDGCWLCRARREELERAARRVVVYRKQRLSTCLPLDPKYRQSFLAKLEQLNGRPDSRSPWYRLFPDFKSLLAPAMNHVFASVMVVSVAAVMLFWIWQRSTIQVSASELLERAETAEADGVGTLDNAVIYQETVIRGEGPAILHPVYRDLSGRRRFRHVSWSAADIAVQRKLVHAGVDWDQPLSAHDYGLWRNGQANRRETVRRTGKSQLTLTTVVPGGDVAVESLTVREEDFHVVKRRFEIRNHETIEVAELKFAVLSRDSVNESLFEPVVPAAEAPPPLTGPVVLGPTQTPTPVQVDLAELSAREALNQTGADLHDQIRVTHSGVGVAIKGIVETLDEKRRLLSRLSQIAFVHSDILSADEMGKRRDRETSRPDESSGRTSVQVFVAPSQPSPLAKLLEERSSSSSQLDLGTRQLLDACFQMQESATRLTEVMERFPSADKLSGQALATRDSLVEAYVRVIRNGLDAELRTLRQLDLGDSELGSATDESGATIDQNALRRSVRRNEELCQELVTATGNEPRPAALIAEEIHSSIQRIRASMGSGRIQSLQP